MVELVSIAIAVVECDDRFLIGRRPPGAVLAGLWEFPGGKVRAGESAEAAAVRECREETGLTVDVQEALPTQRHEYEYGSVQLHFFRCAPVPPVPPPRHPFQWVVRAELERYVFPAGNRELLEQLRQAVDEDPAASRGG